MRATEIDILEIIKRRLMNELQELNGFDNSREISIAKTKLEESCMWLGKDVTRRLNAPTSLQDTCDSNYQNSKA